VTGKVLRFLTAGESHGPELTAILEGMPAGLALDQEDLDRQMARRQKGYGSGGRMKIEKDSLHITAGFMNGLTTGGPIAIRIANLDFAKWRGRDIPPMTIPRPGHADLTGAVKYGYRELRLALERASARETAARVAVGAICRQLLSALDIDVGSYVVAIGDVSADVPADLPYAERFAFAETNDVRCPAPGFVEPMRQRIRAIMKAKDTLGGVFEVVVLGAPPGLGSHVHWDRRLDARLLWSVGSIHAVKGVELGPAFTVLNPRQSVDLASGVAAETVYERSDFCAVPRAAVVGEAMASITVVEAIIEKLGGDTLAEMQDRLSTLRRTRLQDLPMDNKHWRFGYEG
jgi:chorismate synthase